MTWCTYLFQADEGSVIRLSVQHVRLPCGRQWLMIRDGDSLGADLVAQFSGRLNPHPITSSSNFMLLEFFSDDVSSTCHGSFLAHAQQIGIIYLIVCKLSMFSRLSLPEVLVSTSLLSSSFCYDERGVRYGFNIIFIAVIIIIIIIIIIVVVDQIIYP